MRRTTGTFLAVLGLALSAAAPAADPVRVDVVKQPYGGARNVPEISMNPDYIHASGLERLIGEWGGRYGQDARQQLTENLVTRRTHIGHRDSVASLSGRHKADRP